MHVLLTDENGNAVQAILSERVFPVGSTEVGDWISTSEPPIDVKAEYPPGAAVFFDRDSLATFCQFNGITLHVGDGGNLTVGEQARFGNRDWISLERSVALEREDKPQVRSGIESGHTQLWVPKPVYDTLSRGFEKNDEVDAIWCVSSRTIKRAFVYLDVSGFSEYPSGQQALIINTLSGLAHRDDVWGNQDALNARENREAELCIGDGYIYVFSDPLKATLFASWMAELIQQLGARREQMGRRSVPVDFHFRIGAHYGAVYRFWDRGRNNWNYIGDGINGGNRVLGVIEKQYDDILFVSDAVVREFITRSPHNDVYAGVRDCLENRGSRRDKHGKQWRVYLLNHSKLCGTLVQNALAAAPQIPGAMLLSH